MRRSLPPLFLARSPLVVVLGQVRFSPILLMDRFIPDIQDELRRNGFPGYRQGKVEEVTWNFGSDAEPTSQKVVRSRWEFFNVEASWRIVLTEDTLTLATSAYVRYEEPFERFLRNAIATLHARAQLQVVTRLGLRYVDVIEPAENESFDDYLHPRLGGIPAQEVGLREALPYIQIRGLSDAGQMVIRCVYTRGGLPVPPDLVDLDLRISRPTAKRDFAILDFDHFTPAQTPFEIDDTLERLARLHDTLDIAFRHAVTPAALKRWGATDVDAEEPRRAKGNRR